MKVTLDFIYEELADKFDIPCGFSPMDDILMESNPKCAECRGLGKADPKECWKLYFHTVR